MINKLINTLGVEGALILTFLEYLCLPIPSEGVLPILGYQASEGSNYFSLLLLSIIVSLIACILLYSLGYYGGSLLLDKFYNRFKRKQKSIDKCKEFIQKHAKFALIITRMIPLSRTYISLVAGALKCDFYIYLFSSAIGISVWNSILMGLGYAFFNNLDYILTLYKEYKILILIALSVSIIVLLIRRYCIKKR